MKKLLFCLLVLASPVVYGQDEDFDTGDTPEVVLDEDYVTEEEYVDHELVSPADAITTRQYKDENVYHQGFDEAKWREIIGDSDFKEEAPEPELDESMLTPAFQGGSEILKAVGYAVIVAIVILLLYFVFKNVGISSKVKKQGIAPFTTQDPDDIHEMDINGLLRQALAEGNLKMAVRMYFLLLLKNLDDAGLIRWEKDKTNRDYLTELFESEKYYDDVRRLTIGYEEVWYGDHLLPEESLRALIRNFETLQSRINPTNPA